MCRVNITGGDARRKKSTLTSRERSSSTAANRTRSTCGWTANTSSWRIIIRISRLTAYAALRAIWSGTLDRFNNAKRAEERDRVKHGISLQ